MMNKEWLWRCAQLVLTSFVGLGVYTLKVDRKNEMMVAMGEMEKRMQTYCLSRAEFEAYRSSHAEWAQQVILRMESAMNDIRRISQENHQMLREQLKVR